MTEQEKARVENLVKELNHHFKPPLATGVNVSAAVTEEGLLLQINDRAVDFDKNFEVIGTLTGPIGGETVEEGELKRVMREDQEWETIRKKTSELWKLIDKYEGNRASAASWVCTEIAAAGGAGHYEILGILQDAIQSTYQLVLEENEEVE